MGDWPFLKSILVYKEVENMHKINERLFVAKKTN
jgi:hypothetical protein